MTQNATPTALTASQENVLGALLAGRTATEAASIAGIHRSTVHRWLKDPEFLAEFNRHKSELQEAATRRLLGLQMKAIDAVEAAISNGDSRTALAVLRGSGMLDGTKASIGPTDPERVIRNQRAREREQEFLDSMLALP